MAVSGRRALSNLLSSTLRFGSEEDTELCCHPCERMGQVASVSGYCKNCRVPLCNKCITSHQSAASSRNHVITGDVNSSSVSIASDALEKCATHKTEEVKLYCRAHERLGCVICMTLSHKLCEIDYIPETSEEFVRGDEYMCFETNLNNLKERCAFGLSKVESNIVAIETTYASIISSVEKTKKEIINKIDEFEKELKDEVEAFKNRNTESMKTLKKEYEAVVKSIVDIDKTTERLNTDKKYNNLFCKVKQALNKISEYQSEVYRLSKRICIDNCEFERSSEINAFLTKENMLGKLNLVGNEVDHCNAPESVNAQPACHINIKGKDDKKSCYATGLAFLSSNQLAVADKTNKNVKIVDISYDKMISEIPLSSGPRDLTVIPPYQLAVTLRDEKIIQLLSTQSGLAKRERIRTDGHCRGIKFDDGILIVVFDTFASAKIQLMTLKGEVLQTVYQSNDGKLFMAEPKCLGLSPDRKEMYLTDLTKMSLFRL